MNPGQGSTQSRGTDAAKKTRKGQSVQEEESKERVVFWKQRE